MKCFEIPSLCHWLCHYRLINYSLTMCNLSNRRRLFNSGLSTIGQKLVIEQHLWLRVNLGTHWCAFLLMIYLLLCLITHIILQIYLVKVILIGSTILASRIGIVLIMLIWTTNIVIVGSILVVLINRNSLVFSF